MFKEQPIEDRSFSFLSRQNPDWIIRGSGYKRRSIAPLRPRGESSMLLNSN